MKTDLFRKMHQIFKKHTGIRRKTEFFLYVIHKEEKDPLSSKLYKYINGDRTLNEKTLKTIQENDNWVSTESPFSKAVKNNTDLNNLHKEYLPNIKPPPIPAMMPLGTLSVSVFAETTKELFPNPLFTFLVHAPPKAV